MEKRDPFTAIFGHIFDMCSGYQGLEKVISGGQTGADQAGLMAAWRCGIPTGGTAPYNYNTTGGMNPLLEVMGLDQKGDYRSRTELNIRESDATIVLTVSYGEPGSALTRRLCGTHGKPCLSIDLNETVTDLATPGDAGASRLAATIAPIISFIRDHQVRILNVAGNRETSATGMVHKATEVILVATFEELRKLKLLNAAAER